MAKIYISSTYEDLKKEREAAAQAIRRLGHQPVYMEDYVAGPQRPLEKCLEDVRSCDAYLGIFALRYGSTPPGYDKSITHLEYETAKKAGISPLMFLLDQKASWPVEYVDTGQERHRINDLRNELKTEYTVSFFKNADELSGLVSAAVSNLILMWVRSSIEFILTNKDRIKDINKKPYELEGFSSETKNIVMKCLEKDRKNRFKEIEEVLNALQARLNNPWDALLDKKIKQVVSEPSNGKPMPDSDVELKEADFGDGIIMVYIPPGKFEMVSNDFDRKKLTHEVYLDGYRIGKYEVTIKQYMKFVNETNSHYPEWREEGSKYHLKTGSDDYYKKLVSNENSPILGISWKDAGRLRCAVRDGVDPPGRSCYVGFRLYQDIK